MPKEFKGGLVIANRIRLGTPWILAVPTTDLIEFRLRHGLGRAFGPWSLNREDITLVWRTMRGLDMYHGIGIQLRDRTWWTFVTYHPDEVLDRLEQLGYPLDSKTRTGQGRFFAR